MAGPLYDFDGLLALYLNDPFLHKKIKCVFYDCNDIKMNVLMLYIKIFFQPEWLRY